MSEQTLAPSSLSSVEILIDRPSASISLVVIGDDGTETEVSLSQEGAWKLVTEMNQAIQKLTTVVAPVVVTSVEAAPTKPARRRRHHNRGKKRTPEFRETVMQFERGYGAQAIEARVQLAANPAPLADVASALDQAIQRRQQRPVGRR